ncbi:ABC transporter permease [Nonomuraea sp. NPDC050643]|uniref:ABC transporter permease n=1 Tax=Nonomuraea sp. NPDC050643 TaxID=3155660 RepID=UPI0033F58E61
MRRELRAEWTKLRTAPAAWWLLPGVVALTVAGSAAAVGFTTCAPAGCGHDPARVGLFGVQLGQGLVALLAVVAVCGEYGTGMIRTTLTAMPRRAVTLAAKAGVLTGVTLVAGTLGVLGSAVAGFLSGGSALPPRAVVGSVLYLALIALLGLGVATVVRDSAAATGVVLGLLYLFPIAILMIRDEDLRLLLWKISPVNAGLAVQATTDVLPLGPWAGLGVLAAWAAGALLCGGLLLRLRDA